MAPVIASKTVNTWQGSNSSPINIAKPSGLAVGDILIAHISSISEDSNTGTPTIGPDPWTLLGYEEEIDGNGTITQAVYMLVATATEVALTNFTYTPSGGPRWINATMYRITGHGGVDGVEYNDEGSASASPTATYSNSITPIYGDNLMLFLSSAAYPVGSGSASGYAVANDNPTWTEEYDVYGDSNAYFGGGEVCGLIVAASATRSQATSTGNATVNYVNFTGISVGAMISIAPPTSVNYSATVGVINVETEDVTTGPDGEMFGVLSEFVIDTIEDGYTNSVFDIDIRAKDILDRTILSYVGTPVITSTGTLATGSGATDPFVAGVLTDHEVSISNTGTFTITATDGSVTGVSNSFEIYDITPMQNNKGDIYYPVKILPTLSNVKHINIIMAPTAGISGTRKEAALKFYFNMSSTPSFTKYVTRDDIAKGYVSYEINKPYVNSLQIEVEYYNSSNLNPEGLYSTSGEADFCPAYAEIIYERTDTIR